jgi:transposase-like protein
MPRPHLDNAKQTFVIQECLQPGATLSSVAISHGINANVICKWLVKTWKTPIGLDPTVTVLTRYGKQSYR